MKKFFGSRMDTSNLIAVAIYALCGLAMLLWPEFMKQFANYIVAGAFCVIAVLLIISYFRSPALEGVQHYRLATGLVLLLCGIVMFSKPNLLSSIIPFIWGMAMIVGGFGKVQMSFDLKRIGDERWWIMLLTTLVSFTLGVICVLQPDTMASAITVFIGISLLVEAVLDLLATLTLRKHVRDAMKIVDSKVEGTVE